AKLRKIMERGGAILERVEVSQQAEDVWTTSANDCLAQTFGTKSAQLRGFWPPVDSFQVSSAAYSEAMSGNVDAHREAGRRKQLKEQIAYLRELIESQDAELMINSSVPSAVGEDEDLLDIFICHSVADQELAKAFIHLVRNALAMPPE